MTQVSKKVEFELSEPVELPSSPPVAPTLVAEEVLGKLRLLWRERQFIYRVTAIGLVLATVVAFLIPKQYESTTRLMPPDNQSSTTMAMLAALTSKAGAGLGSYAGGLMGLKSSGELFVGILQSRTVQDQLVNRFNLKKVYHVKLEEDARKQLTSNTAISEDRKSGIIAITVTDPDASRAAAMGAAYADELNRLVEELSTSGAHRERVFLEERLKTVQKDLQDAEKDFSQFSSKNMAIDIKEQGKAMVEAAAVLQGQLIAAQSEEEGLRQIYTDNNVRVRSVQARIGELKKELEKLGGKGEGSDAEAISSTDSLYPSIKKLPLLGVTYADMYRRTKVQEAVFEALTQQFELAKVEEVREIPSVKVLDPADVPERKSFPPRMLIMVLGVMFSFAFANAWILGSTRWQEMDSRSPSKTVVETVFRSGRTHLLRLSENGSHLGRLIRHARRFGLQAGKPD
jgi:capsule polysaccharide export protein KpsE/RkpR